MTYKAPHAEGAALVLSLSLVVVHGGRVMTIVSSKNQCVLGIRHEPISLTIFSSQTTEPPPDRRA